MSPTTILPTHGKGRKPSPPATLTAAVLCVAVCLAACTTTNPETGQREYDPVKTEAIKAAVHPLAASLVRRVVTKNPQTAQYFARAAATFADARDRGFITPEEIARQLDEAARLEGWYNVREEWAELAIESKNIVLALYSINYAYRFKVDLAPDKFLWHLADALAQGINQGIAEASP